MNAILHWLEGHQLSCFYKSIFGMECPGCGMQTALIFLLKGDFYGSFQAYPPLGLFLFMGGFLLSHLIFKFRNGGTWLMYSFLLTASAVLINFIYQILVHS